jgi:hypothetical protein
MLKSIQVMIVVSVLCIAHIAQSGGTYDLKDSVIANGGGTSSGGNYEISGTAGQNFASGSALTGGGYSHTTGFWYSQLVPTAAGVMIAGRVLGPTGIPLRMVRITLTGPSGLPRRTLSSTFGYYQFDDVEVGTTYLLQAVDRQFQFTPRVVTVADEMTELDIIANP